MHSSCAASPDSRLGPGEAAYSYRPHTLHMMFDMWVAMESCVNMEYRRGLSLKPRGVLVLGVGMWGLCTVPRVYPSGSSGA